MTSLKCRRIISACYCKFTTAESAGESILKIGQHIAKLGIKAWRLPFLRDTAFKPFKLHRLDTLASHWSVCNLIQLVVSWLVNGKQ